MTSEASSTRGPAKLLEILSWNMAGWTRVQSGNSEIPFIHPSYDIVALQETWTGADLELDGYNSFKLEATPGLGSGRLKGGLGILVSTQLKAVCIALDPLSHLAMAILICWDSGKILFFNVYLPPQRKTADSTAFYQALEQYIQTTSQEHPDAKVLVVGDFNARIGPDNDALCAKYNLSAYDHAEVGAYSLLPRLSKDPCSNFAGACLASMAYKLSLSILNGSLNDDYPGEFTFMAGTRASTIDYMLLEGVSLNKVRGFQVLPFLEGDHFPLHLQLCPPCNHCRFEVELPIQILSTNRTGCRIKWSDQLDLKLKEVIAAENLSSICKAFSNVDVSQNPISGYNLLVDRLKPVLFKDSFPDHQKLSKTRKPWFDKECVKAKGDLARAFSLYSKAGIDCRRETFDTVLELKKKYKKLLYRKKIQYGKELWETLIQSVKDKNNSLFWKLTSGSDLRDRSPIDVHISPHTWVVYFQNLYNDSNCQYNPCLLMGIEEWPPVSCSETKSLIQQLRCKKAPGLDGIPPEFIKNNEEWWAPFLAALFSYINTTGQIPKSWETAIIVPF